MLDSLFQKNRPRSLKARRAPSDPYAAIEARVKMTAPRAKARSPKELQKRIEQKERELYAARAEKRRQQKEAENIIPAPASWSRTAHYGNPDRMTKHQAALVKRDNFQQAICCVFLLGVIVAMAVAVFRVLNS